MKRNRSKRRSIHRKLSPELQSFVDPINEIVERVNAKVAIVLADNQALREENAALRDLVEQLQRK